MKILLIGLGSIGQRHLRNLYKINPKFKFIAVRKIFKVPILTNNLKISRSTKSLKEKYNIKYYKNLNLALKEKPNFAVICSPTSFHLDQTIKCIEKNVNVFIEKPLAHNEKKLNKLKKLLTKKTNIISMVGYQTRFNPLYIYLKKYLRKKNLGKINHIEIFNGEHLADFHKYEDYRISFASKKILGGGVVLTSIHEIDYFLDLFSDYKIKIISSHISKNSKLDIDVEDTLNSNFLVTKKGEKFTVNLHLNYYTRPKKRYIKIILEKGILYADLNRNYFQKYSNKLVFKKRFLFSRNLTFINEMKFFVKNIKEKKIIKKNLSIYNGIKTLQFAMNLKNNKWT
jgi:predicted dehydrogenase